MKGRGAIVLMYGPPGTGKTLTAEKCADSLKRALVRVQLGALGQPENLKDVLIRAFERARKYKAILLLDEVDIFVRQRGVHPALDESTAVFLRILEYFDGILIMTTNLGDQIDDAIFSRAHLVLGYDAPGPDERRQMWSGFLTKELRVTDRAQ